MKLTTSKRVVQCRHKDYIHLNIKIDCSELWDGSTDERRGGRRNNWAGGFKGRPILADQLFPTIQRLANAEKPKNIKNRLSHIRNFFRFLDAYEIWSKQHPHVTFATDIQSLADITTHQLQMWKTPSPAGQWRQAYWDTYRTNTQILKQAALQLGMAHLQVPSYSRDMNVDRNEIPNETTGKTLVRLLAREVNRIWSFWEHADSLAAKGRNLLGIERVPVILPSGANTGATTIVVEGGVTEADLHATYRAAVAANNHLPLDRVSFLKVWGYGKVGTPAWWPRYGADHPDDGKHVRMIDLQGGIYPTSEQIAALFLLFLARTGWNPSTAETLNITNGETWSKAYTEKFIWLFAYKVRAGNWQDTVSIKKHRTGAYQIISRLIVRTERLRQAFATESSLCTNSKIAKRSPWLYQRINQRDKIPVRVGSEQGVQAKVLLRLITKHNAMQSNRDRLIPVTVTPTDLRDIFAASTYVNSDFSLFITQMALGHKSPSMTFSYLRRRAWRAESEKKKNWMFTTLIDQIETHRMIDLTLLRARMDGINLTQEHIARLEASRKFRTYVGMGCSDPTQPPAYIDATNPRDGTTHCIQGHLCGTCTNGRVFNDSLPFMARRRAELEWLRDTLPIEVFQGSSLADQLMVLGTTLTQWHAKVVDEQVAHWAAKIISGEHQPIRIAGEH